VCVCRAHTRRQMTCQVSRWSVCSVVVDMSQLLPPSAPMARAESSQQVSMLPYAPPLPLSLSLSLPACLPPPPQIISRSQQDRETDRETDRDRQNLTKTPNTHRSVLRALRQCFDITLSSALRARACVRAGGRAGMQPALSQVLSRASMGCRRLWGACVGWCLGTRARAGVWCAAPRAHLWMPAAWARQVARCEARACGCGVRAQLACFSNLF
jgi:hypothetical protein